MHGLTIVLVQQQVSLISEHLIHWIRGEAIMPINLRIINFSNFYNFA